MTKKQKLRRRCRCFSPPRNHSREYCKESCKACNELAAEDAAQSDIAEKTKERQ